MKSKTLLIAAAALAAGVMTSQAQVYSQNIVGYINVPLSSGYNLIANQLDLDGTGTNNNINTTLTALPKLSKVLPWTGAGFGSSSTFNGTSWTVNNQALTNSMNPGNGFFLFIPGTGVTTNVTFVGNVITGTNTYPINTGYQILAPSGPVAGTLDTTNGLKPKLLDKILVWTGAGYGPSSTYSGTAWNGAGDPQLSVGEAVFYDAHTANTWTEILNVQ